MATRAAGERLGRLRAFASTAAFLYLSATVMVVGSERIYWYWTGISVDSLFGIGVFYLLPAMAGLWVIALTPARHPMQLVLAGAVFAFVVEGVLTPVIYEDGPLPLMAAMFVGWHGLLAFFVLWYVLRRLLVQQRGRDVAVVSMMVGCLWGAWQASSSLLDTQPPDGGTVLTPAGFIPYAVAVGATLAASHGLLSRVWPCPAWRPSRRATLALALAAVIYHAAAVVPLVPWAPLKLAVLVGGTVWLVRHSTAAMRSSPTVLETLAGDVRLRDLAWIGSMPATAVITYSAVWANRTGWLPQTAFAALLILQVGAGAVAYVAAARWALRARRSTSVGAVSAPS